MSENNGGAINPATGTSGNPQTGERYEVGKPDAHQRLDSKDERSIANNLADAERVEAIEKKHEEEAEEARRHPTNIAKSHGNEPSRGAKIDEQIAAEEEAELKAKGKA